MQTQGMQEALKSVHEKENADRCDGEAYELDNQDRGNNIG